jgi:hypothetical protein
MRMNKDIVRNLLIRLHSCNMTGIYKTLVRTYNIVNKEII